MDSHATAITPHVIPLPNICCGYIFSYFLQQDTYQRFLISVLQIINYICSSSCMLLVVLAGKRCRQTWFSTFTNVCKTLKKEQLNVSVCAGLFLSTCQQPKAKTLHYHPHSPLSFTLHQPTLIASSTDECNSLTISCIHNKPFAVQYPSHNCNLLGVLSPHNQSQLHFHHYPTETLMLGAVCYGRLNPNILKIRSSHSCMQRTKECEWHKKSDVTLCSLSYVNQCKLKIFTSVQQRECPIFKRL